MAQYLKKNKEKRTHETRQRRVKWHIVCGGYSVLFASNWGVRESYKMAVTLKMMRD